MVKLFLLNLWSNIKRSPIVAVFLILQMILFSYAIFDILFTQSQSEINDKSLHSTMSKYSMYFVDYKESTPEFIYRATAGAYKSPDDTGFSDFKPVYDKIMANENILTAVCSRNILTLPDELPGIPKTEDNTSWYSFYVPVEVPDRTVYEVKTFSVDRNFFDIFGVILSHGRFFTDDEYKNFDPTHLPAILGYDYKKYFSIGDTFEGTMFAGDKMTTYEVIGFITEGQFFIEPGNATWSFDSAILLPQVDKPLEEWAAIYEEYHEYLGSNPKPIMRYYLQNLGTNGAFISRYLLTEIGTENEFMEFMNGVFEETNTSDCLKVGGRPASTYQTLDEVREKDTVLAVLVGIMLVFTLMGTSFSAVNNASNNMKAYAIHHLIGATKMQVLMYSVFETFLYSAVGLAVGFMIKYGEILHSGLKHLPATPLMLEKSVFAAVSFLILACVLSFIFVYFKVRNYSVSELIRGSEVKKSGHLTLYKAITFIMFMLSSICITFLVSYNWQLEHIDRYQNNFWGGTGLLYYFNISPGKDSTFSVEYETDQVESYSFDILVRSRYDTEEGPPIRGWYRQGEMEIPNVTEGRFFTEEEMTKAVRYAVVGKNVLKDFVVEKDGKRTFTYENQTFEVIGVVGREGHETSLDDWVFLTLPSAFSYYPMTYGNIYIETKDPEDKPVIGEFFEEQFEGRFAYQKNEYRARIDLGISKKVVDAFIILIFLTGSVFCIYFIDKIRYIINIKKFLGYSKHIIMLDAQAEFLSLSTGAFIIGNTAMYIIAKTLLKNVSLFSAYTINLPVLTFSYSLILLVSLLFSFIAINKSFRGSARDIKRG